MEKRISVRAVHRGRVLGVEGNRLANFVEREIGRVRFAIHFQLRKFSSEFAVRGQDSGNTGERPKISVGEFVGAGDGTPAGIVDVPGADLASSVDFAFGFCVREYSVEV